jgi:hypothetical protein
MVDSEMGRCLYLIVMYVFLDSVDNLLVQINEKSRRVKHSAAWQSACQQTHDFAPPPRGGFAFYVTVIPSNTFLIIVN